MTLGAPPRRGVFCCGGLGGGALSGSGPVQACDGALVDHVLHLIELCARGPGPFFAALKMYGFCAATLVIERARLCDAHQLSVAFFEVGRSAL
eukprot:8584960-Alexandrium_andersonii.AAC.1